MTADLTPLLDQVWSDLVSGSESPAPRLELEGEGGHLPARLAVEEAAVACVGTALRAGCHLVGGRPSLHLSHVAAAVRSERYFRVGDREAGPGFAALSRFWAAADGWVRTHANYPWHRDALAAALDADAEPAAIAAAIARRKAEDIEEQVFGAGGVAAAVRTAGEWRRHPQGRQVAGEALIGHHRIGEAAPRRTGLPPFRVLDVTRVIAGPVCTRYLGAFGAEVLRIDPPHRPDMTRGQRADTLLGKRSSFLDLRAQGGLAQMHRLLESTDVLVCGYRPGALEELGLDDLSLAERHAGLVVIRLDAWGHRGPWAGRRGFDSVVQAPTGIAAAEAGPGSMPGALPCQLLDHGTGYLAAAAAFDGLRRQRAEGGTHIRRVSLARTAMWLTDLRSSAIQAAAPHLEPADWSTEWAGPNGSIRAVLPPGKVDARQLQWPGPPAGYGNSPPDYVEASGVPTGSAR